MKKEKRRVDEKADSAKASSSKADSSKRTSSKSGPSKSGSPKPDPTMDYQELAKRTWEAFASQLQKPLGAGIDDFFKASSTQSSPPQSSSTRSSSTKTSPTNPTLANAIAGLKSYADWMQGAAATVSTPQDNWRQQMNQLFGGTSQPFSQGFSSQGFSTADSASTRSFVEQWQAMLQAVQKDGFSGGQQGSSSPFGFNRDQQAQQQDFATAITRHLEASQRYQSLIQRSNAQAMEKMQSRLAKLAVPGEQIESLKVLYDLWVDCAEEAYAEIALSDEFRVAYAEMVNTQIRVRQLQQEQTEYLCQQLGIPTRSDVSSLGERLQSLRREMRNNRTTAPATHAEDIAALRREVAALKQDLLAKKKPASSAGNSSVNKTAAKKSQSAVKKSVPRPSSKKSRLEKSQKIAVAKTAKVSASRMKSGSAKSVDPRPNLAKSEPDSGTRKRK
jgi:class III poly(R)-hydroxyalkanoic acid synthase PhaE subunit